MLRCRFLFTILLAYFTLTLFKSSNGASMDHMQQLYDDLFYSYNKIGRPNKNASDKIYVNFASFLLQLIDVDEKSQVLTLSMWIELQWNDSRLIWEPELYGGQKKISVPNDQVWTPDIILYNNAVGEPQITLVTDVYVYHDGKVLWSVPSVYKAFCLIDVTYFPYDIQNCTLKFGGWTYTFPVMDIIPERGDQETTPFKNEDLSEGDELAMGMDLSYFTLSAEWDLLRLSNVRTQREYPGCCGPERYVDVTFYIKIRRKPLFYTINLVIPCMLIAFLTTFVFYLTDHKITFAISIMVALSVFWMVLIDLIPPNSEVVPLFTQYLMFTMGLVFASIIATIVILNIQHRNNATNVMHPWTRLIFLNYLPRLLRMKLPEWHKIDPKLEAVKKHIRKSIALNERYCGSFSSRRHSPFYVKLGMEEKTLDRETRLSEIAMNKGMHPAVIREMINNVSRIADHFATIEDEVKGSDDWSYVAFVIDRICFIVFSLINIIVTFLIIYQNPDVFKEYKALGPVPNGQIAKPLGADILAKQYE